MAGNLTIKELLAQGLDRLGRAHRSISAQASSGPHSLNLALTEDAASLTLDAELLLAHVLGKNRTYLATHPEAEATADQVGRLGELLERRAAGEPIAYIVGYRDFWTL